MPGNWLPTAAQQQLLDAALLPDPMASTALKQWLAEAGEQSSASSLYPINYLRHKNQAPVHPHWQRFVDSYQQTREHNQKLLQGLQEFFAICHEQGIDDVIVLKGMAMLYFYIDDLGARPMRDIDVLLKPEQVATVLKALEKAGWYCQADDCDFIQTETLNARHALAYSHPSIAPFTIDMHWHLVPELRNSKLAEQLWQDKQTVDHAGTLVYGLAAEHMLLHIILHGSKVTPTPAIHWVLDAVLIIKQGIDWQKFVAITKDHQANLVCLQALSYLQRCDYIEVPKDILALLINAPIDSQQANEYFLRTSKYTHSVLSHASTHWYSHRRQHEKSLLHSLVTFPHYLKNTWGLNSYRALPKRIVQKIRRYLYA